MKILTVASFMLAAAAGSAAPYAPQPVPLPDKGAPYLTADGSIYVAGNDLVDDLFQQLNEIFVKTHPGFKFKQDMIDSNLAVTGLTAGRSALGPIGREAMPQEIRAFVARFGYPPKDFLLGYDQSPDPDIFPPGKHPPAIWVNVRNPLPKLTLKQVAKIFTSGGADGDITAWRQLGLGGEWANREIHVYLPANRDAAFLFNLRDQLGKAPFTARAEQLPGIREVMAAVAQDPYGIGIIGYWPGDAGWDRQAEYGPLTKLVPLAATADDRFSRAAPGEHFPIAPGIHLFVNQKPGTPLEPWIAEYVRLALSDDGQKLIRDKADTDGFVALDPDERDRQLAKLK